MGQKVHPISFRLGYIKTWSSRWYARNQDFAKFLHEDLKIRKHVLKTFAQAAIGHAHPFGRPGALHRLHDRGAGQHQVGPIGADTGLGRATGGAEPRGRWALTFGFGLIHGFGFASVLRDLGVGNTREGIAIPLLTFNLGVELGQIAVASAVLPIIWQLRKNDRFLKQGVPAMSAVVAVAGFYWLLQRTLWS